MQAITRTLDIGKTMRNLVWFSSLLLIAHIVSGTVRATEPTPAPEFTHTAPSDWINSAPLRLTELRGKVVLMDVWTFGCWNCYRSFPWLKDLETRLAQKDFLVIGIHSPEFEHERERDKVVQKMAKFGLTHPVMLDNDFSYWRALGNRYWPAFYLIDKRGNLRHVFVGETHAGDQNARAMEQAIKTLLAESADPESG